MQITDKADIGVVGLAVMGENLILNMESKGFVVACYNRTVSKVDDFVNGRAAGKNIIGCRSIEQLVVSLKRPRRVMLMVKAGGAVDELIERLLPLLEDGDIIIDGGNSHYLDTARRVKYVQSRGKLYIGTGISGGQEGALHGPSIMPGGSATAWPAVRPIFETIAAYTDDNQPCCTWIGPAGSGHFVKMVHNGIEYGDMQIICEAYALMKDGLGLSNSRMSDIFARWNGGKLKSHLVEITADILSCRDEQGQEVIDRILDVAGQKGTGRWAGISALEYGVPLTLISEAVFARYLSAMKEQRTAASKIFAGDRKVFDGDADAFVNDLQDAVYASRIVSYTQGFALMAAASQANGWGLDYGMIALIWRGGCIIRSVFLDRIKEAYDRNNGTGNFMLDPFFRHGLLAAQAGWRRTVSTAVQIGIAVPAMSCALAYFDAYRTERLPANLLQAQRDYFGAHQYQRIDRPPDQFFHTNWTGRGGATSASACDV